MQPKGNTIAVMQPYFFPYLGYFQLIQAVDTFVFYDDVNYIKNGWVNRNRILINGNANYFTVQLKGASPNKLINEIEFTDNRKKLLRTLEISYKKAPFFFNIHPIIEDVLNYETTYINELAIYSVKKICEYLDFSTNFKQSSISYPETQNFERFERLVAICKKENATTYINSWGGQKLYDKTSFKEKQIELFFIKNNLTPYPQFSNSFISSLSILDVLMFNSKETVKQRVENYTLE